MNLFVANRPLYSSSSGGQAFDAVGPAVLALQRQVVVGGRRGRRRRCEGNDSSTLDGIST